MTLAELGLNFQLGHKLGTPCPSPAIITKFVIIDVDGIHTVNMAFCDCTQGIERHIQLLRRRLFPATTIYPQTAITFRVLYLFQLLSFMSKVSAYEFYHTLARVTDNSGLYTPPVMFFLMCQYNIPDQFQDRYQTFLRVVREWHHICALKRFGRGHEPGGIKGTPPIIVWPALSQA